MTKTTCITLRQKSYLSLDDIVYDRVDGFMGENCRHDWSMYFVGISEPNYTKEQLNEFKNAKVTYNNIEMPAYEGLQKQRSFERGIKKSKQTLVMYDEAIKNTDDLQAKATFQQDFEKESVKLKTKEAKLADFCKQTGLPRDRYREQVFATTTENGIKNWGKSTSQKAVWANKKSVDNSVNSSIMKTERNFASRYMASGLRKPPSHILTDAEIELLKVDIKAIGADKRVFRFNEGNRTGFNDRNMLINIRGDVLPDFSSNNPRDLMSSRATIAHEYYGHYMFHPSNYEVGDWRDEMRASYIAAIKTPNLSAEDRKNLMIDAYNRAKEAGYNYKYSKKAVKIIYGY